MKTKHLVLETKKYWQQIINIQKGALENMTVSMKKHK